MNALASLGLAVATLLGQPQTAPPVPMIRVPAPNITKPLSAEAKAQNQKHNACRAAAYGQTYLPQPAIWRISDKDTIVYLFGSFHMLPPGFDWRSSQFDEIVAKSDKLILESVSPGPRPATPASSTSPLPPLRDRLSGERRAKWVGMTVLLQKTVTDRIDRLPDAQAGLLIATLPLQNNPLFVLVSPGVEAQLRSDFQRVSKPIEGLEQPESAMPLLDQLAPPVQRAILDQVLDHMGETKPSSEPLRMFHSWARGEPVEEPSEAAQHPELNRVLLDVRNAAWVPEVRKQLGPPGTRLIVVGAGHLRGPNNLLELLAAAGIKAERVSPTVAPAPRSAFSPAPKSIGDCFRIAPPSGLPFPLPLPPQPVATSAAPSSTP